MVRQAAGMSGFEVGDAVIVVTGAAAGIGLGIAQAFHAAGARVALGDLRKDAVERAAAGLGDERIFADVVDVRDEKSVQAAVQPRQEIEDGAASILFASALPSAIA
jgi:NADP-dependent 3-hydroxy acid dehydrogenase YdfG